MAKASRYHGPDPWETTRRVRRPGGSRLRIASVIAIAAVIGILLGGISAFA